MINAYSFTYDRGLSFNSKLSWIKRDREDRVRRKKRREDL